VRFASRFGKRVHPVRILKVVQAYYPFQEQGGPVYKVRALARELAGRGHEVTVLTADLGLSRYNGSLGQIHSSPWGAHFNENGVGAIYLPVAAKYRAATWNPKAAAFSQECVNQFDVAHFYGLYDLLGPVVGRFCRSAGVPYLIEPMGMYRPIDRSFRLKKLWQGTLGKKFWDRAARIVATSELEQRELMEDGVPAQKLVMRYNGIDLSAYQALPPRGLFRAKWKIPPVESPKEPMVLFLSRLIPRKGADLLIDAFREACPDRGRLVIAGPEGEPGYRPQLERRAVERGVGARVIFTGPLYDEEKRQALVDADVFALPSRYENFANVVAEAMACGVPVIVSEKCGICSLVEGRAGLVIPAEKASLVRALRQMLSDGDLYHRFQKGCGDVIQQLGWDRLAEEMEQHYVQVLAAVGARA
jgi:glycosyltransferase involved in cell wall biosynthesis